MTRKKRLKPRIRGAELYLENSLQAGVGKRLQGNRKNEQCGKPTAPHGLLIVKIELAVKSELKSTN
jgi:hypothetical protein